MTSREELIEKIQMYEPNCTLEELKGSNTQRLEYLAHLLEMQREVDHYMVLKGRSNHPRRLGAEALILDEDDEILDVFGLV